MPGATIVHVGDLHLHPGPRQSDRVAALDTVIAEGSNIPTLACWAFTGDIYHARSTVEDRNIFKERVKKAANAAPVIIVYGNHDTSGDLDILADLHTIWPVYVASRPGVFVFDIPVVGHTHGRKMAAFCLPYPYKVDLERDGAAARTALSEWIAKGAETLKEAEAQGAIGFVLAHADVAGAERSNGQPNVGTEISLDAELLAPLKGRYIGLGHIHNAQEIAGAVYAGSLCRLDWGETENKGYVRVDYADDGRYDWLRMPLVVPPMYHVDVAVNAEGWSYEVPDDPSEASKERGWPLTWDGCEVRVRVRYPQSLKSLLDAVLPQIHSTFKNALRLAVEPVCVPDRALRAPAVALAKTMTEKLTAWAVVTGVVLPEHIEEKLFALELSDADAIVASVEAELRETRREVLA